MRQRGLKTSAARRRIAGSVKVLLSSLTPGVAAAVIGVTLIAPDAAIAGGGADKLMLVIDPTSKEAMYIGNYYKQARGIPDSNVLYLTPTAFDYADFVDVNARIVVGAIEERGVSDHIDYILLAPIDRFWLSASGLVTDNCSPVTRFSLSSIYSSVFISDDILAGAAVGTPNHYADVVGDIVAFDSETTWYRGEPSERSDAERYFIASTLGYLGERGNTVDEIIAMIDRSVAIDGQRPAGTFYFQTTNDSARSGPRDDRYDAAVVAIESMGGSAVNNCCDPLPIGADDCLGVMTGAATIDIPGAGITIQPGAFCDHLTSWAATFDRASQTKVSEWIANGASGSYGAVEEPCNYAQKFPHPRLHVYYYQGASLGESLFRSLAWFPYQGLSYGDPLTRPFAYLPEVTIRENLDRVLRGLEDLTPRGRTDHPGATIGGFELQIDGRKVGEVRGGGQSFRLDTRRLSDGVHELRVIAYDDSPLRSQGEFARLIRVNNTGAIANLEVFPTSGDLSTFYQFTVDPGGAEIAEARILSNGRVVAASDDVTFPIIVYGATLGAGEVEALVEVEFADGRVARSEPVSIDVAFDVGTPSAVNPIAYSYTTTALTDIATPVELPGSFDDAEDELTYDIIDNPTQATLIGRSSQPYRLLVPNPGAAGVDQFTYRVHSSTGMSEIATVTIVYDTCGPRAMSLNVGPLIGGQTGEFVVSCGYPNERVWLAYSRRGFGSTYVPQLGIVVDLAQPELADGPMTTNANGLARWRIDIPDTRNPVLVWFQAIQLGQKSNVVDTQIN